MFAREHAITVQVGSAWPPHATGSDVGRSVEGNGRRRVTCGAVTLARAVRGDDARAAAEARSVRWRASQVGPTPPARATMGRRSASVLAPSLAFRRCDAAGGVRCLPVGSETGPST